ncbi:MAG: hypothetical protein NT019_00525 [Candidatus Adlerbacteria bacterium]|nr:hypothetical protein [Candidatus Adlerbacteria bacterium]
MPYIHKPETTIKHTKNIAYFERMQSSVAHAILLRMSLSPKDAKELSQLQTLLGIFLGLYFLAGLSTFFLFSSAHDKSFPPFFHWFLFALVPNEHFSTQYTVQLTAYRGKTFTPPELFGEANDIIPEATANRARDGIRHLGKALVAGDTARADVVRAELEAAYFPKDLSWQVVKITYDPIERFKTGTLEKVDVLGTYHTK